MRMTGRSLDLRVTEHFSDFPSGNEIAEVIRIGGDRVRFGVTRDVSLFAPWFQAWYGSRFRVGNALFRSPSAGSACLTDVVMNDNIRYELRHETHWLDQGCAKGLRDFPCGCAGPR